MLASPLLRILFAEAVSPAEVDALAELLALLSVAELDSVWLDELD